MLVGSEMAPVNSFQAACGAISILVGSIIAGIMFGNMAVLMQNLNKKFVKMQESQDMANTAMKNIKLPTQLQEQVLDYITRTWSNQDNQQEFITFVGLLSPSICKEVY